MLDVEEKLPDTPMLDSVRMYLDEIGRIPRFTPEEEREITQKYAETKDPQLLNEIVERNLRLSARVAKEFVHGDWNIYLDLVQEGNLGLMRAAKTFNPSLGFRFSTYAMWWLRQRMGRYQDNTERSIRLPVHLMRELRKFRWDYQNYVDTNLREPSYDELLGFVNNDAEKLRLLYSHLLDTACLNTPVGVNEHGEVTEMIDFVEAETNTEDEALINNLNEDLDWALSLLNDKECEVLIKRFGLHGNAKMSLEAIGDEKGVTREYIRQIEARAIRKLKHNPRARARLKDYWEDAV